MTPQRRTGIQLVALVLTLVVTTVFVIPPFYDWFCRVTGYGGATSTADSAPQQILDQTVIVRFDASKEAGMPWDFAPVERQMTVRIGEVGLAFYEAYNPTDRAVAGTASYNVAPENAGAYFTKIDCFCFEMQVLQPGERVQMPVTFYVDPEIMQDPEARFIPEITLSYTFHETALPEEAAALTPASTGAVN